MKILFVTGGPAMPQMLGGSQRTSDAIIRGLIARGHSVELLSALIGTGSLGLRGRLSMKIWGRKAAPDKRLGYRAWRAWTPSDAVEEVAARIRPDIAVVLAHGPVAMATALRHAGIPILMAFQDNEVGADLAALMPMAGVANSAFTARHYRERFGVDAPVVHPVVVADAYRTATDRRFVTFINPDAKKGLDIALATAAALPGIPFLFVEGWPLEPAARVALEQALAALPNVTLHPSVSDMRDIYRQTRILLAPSRWEEGYGRVATEAQFSGIPVVGSDRGGLPEAIGPGGVVLPIDAAPSLWAATIESLWNDDRRYDELARAATAHAGRPAMQVDQQVATWEQAIRDALTDQALHG